MTSYWFYKMAAIVSQSTSGFWFGHVWHLGRSKAIGIPYFDQISQSMSDILLFPVYEKNNGRHIEILLSVSILTFSLPSACNSALAWQILCKSDDRRRSYDVILNLQNGGHSVANQLPVLVWPCLTYKKVQSYRHTKFWPHISIHGGDILFLKINSRPIEILLWASILTSSLPPASGLPRENIYRREAKLAIAASVTLTCLHTSAATWPGELLLTALT